MIEYDIAENADPGFMKGFDRLDIFFFCTVFGSDRSLLVELSEIIHVINGIIRLSDLKMLRGMNLKILILGYKEIRRGETYLKNNSAKIRTNKRYLYTYLPEIVNDNWFKAVSFDNLAIKQLEVKRIMNEDKWNEFYMGDDGKFTFYIDMVNGKFAKNSCVLAKHEIGDKSIDEMFNIIKEEK